MLRVFKRDMRANLLSTLIWAVIILVLSVAGFSKYSMTAVDTAGTGLDSVINMMPRIVRVMFGVGDISLGTPQGWYICMYLWCGFATYIHAALIGADIISKEESDKTSEFLYSKPIKRSSVIWGKLLAASAAVTIINLLGWISIVVVFLPFEGVRPIVGFINLTIIGKLITSFVFLLTGIFFSAVARGRGKAVQYSSITLIAAYFIYIAIEMESKLGFIKFLSPFCYFDAASVYNKGLRLPFILLSAIIIAAAGYLTHRLYSKRDLHG